MNENIPIIAYAGWHRPKKPHFLQWHSHQTPELVLAAGNANRTEFENHTVFDCVPGSLIVTPAGLLHQQIDTPGAEVFYIGFDEMPEAFDTSVLRMIPVGNDPYIGTWLRQIVELFTQCDEREEAGLLLQVVFRRLRELEHQQELQAYRHPALSRAIHILAEHPGTTISLEELASQSGISPSRLNWHFRRELQMSILEYRTNLRMLQARRLLADPMKTVSEVAELCGYPDANYFSRIFRKIHQCTPCHYRSHLPAMLRAFAWSGAARGERGERGERDATNRRG